MNLNTINTSGFIAEKESKILIFCFFLIFLFIIIPILILCIFFINNSLYKKKIKINYKYYWILELIIWIWITLITFLLSIISFKSTKELDFKKKIKYIYKYNNIYINNTEMITIKVYALDWKWLFIYPNYNIAIINELYLPIDTPIKLEIISLCKINTFYVPSICGQIYAMPKMISILNIIINNTGKYIGFSSNYNGVGFSYMKFNLYGLYLKNYKNIINKIKNNKFYLNDENLKILFQPSIKDSIKYFSKVSINFKKIFNKIKI